MNRAFAELAGSSRSGSSFLSDNTSGFHQHTHNSFVNRCFAFAVADTDIVAAVVVVAAVVAAAGIVVDAVAAAVDAVAVGAVAVDRSFAVGNKRSHRF